MFALQTLRNVSSLPHLQRGLTTVEYAIAGGLVGAAVIVAFFTLGGNVGEIIDYISGQLTVPA